MKYFWYYRRTAYRAANYKNGFFAATLGFNLASKNHDYCTGYYVAVGKMQAQAEELFITVEQLRQAEAKIETLQAAANKSKRTVGKHL